MSSKDRAIVTVHLTHTQLIGSQKALQRLSQLELEKNAAYWIGKTLQRISGKLSVASKSLNRRRFELVKELGEQEMQVIAEGEGDVELRKVPTGNWNVLPENEEQFQTRWDAILEETVDIEILPVLLSMLGDNKLTSNDAGQLEWLLVPDDAEA